MRRGRREDLLLRGRIPGSGAWGRQSEKYMDGIRKVVGDGNKNAHVIQMTDWKVWQFMVANVCRGTAHR